MQEFVLLPPFPGAVKRKQQKEESPKLAKTEAAPEGILLTLELTVRGTILQSSVMSPWRARPTGVR